MKAISDRQLLDRFKRDHDQDTCEEMLQRHARMIYGVCLRSLEDRAQAIKAAMAVFLLLLRKRVNRRRVPAGWVYAQARKVCRHLDHFRDADQAKELGRVVGEVRACLDPILEALPSSRRDAIILRYLERRPQAELSRELACGEDRVRVILRSGLKRLRRQMSKAGFTYSGVALAEFLNREGDRFVPPAFFAKVMGLLAKTRCDQEQDPELEDIVRGSLKAAFWRQLTGAVIVVLSICFVLAVVAFVIAFFFMELDGLH